MLEYGKRVSKVELLVDDGGAVGLHAIVGEVFLLLGEEASIRSRLRQVPEGEKGEGHRAAAFHDEQITPIGQITRFDLEHAECEEASEGGGDALGGIEDG